MIIDFSTGAVVDPRTPLSQSTPASRRKSEDQLVHEVAGREGKTIRQDFQPPKSVDVAKTIKSVAELNDFAHSVGRELHFSIHKESGRLVIRVVNSENEELIRQIPPAEAIKLAEFLQQAVEMTTTGLVEKA